MKGAEGGEKGITEKGGPAELSNQRPSNRSSSGDVFKGSFPDHRLYQVTSEMWRSGRGRGVWDFWMVLLSGFVRGRSTGLSDFSISSGSRFNLLVVQE